jgi:hypothetical protein
MKIDQEKIIKSEPVKIATGVDMFKTSSTILAGFITAIIVTILGSPFIAIGIGIGYLIWK